MLILIIHLVQPLIFDLEEQSKLVKFLVPLFCLIVLKTVNLFNIFFHLAYIGLLISAAAEYSGKLITGKGFLANFKPTGKLYAKRFNDEVLPELANFNVHLEESFNKIVYSHDIETTLKAAGISYILYKLTSWFSLYTLIFIFVVLIFTVPVIYKTYKKEIDAAVADITKTIKTKSAEFTEKAHKAAGPHIDTLIKKTGPIGSFIQSKLPVRTAGSTVGDSKATSYGTDADKSIAGTTSATGTFLLLLTQLLFLFPFLLLLLLLLLNQFQLVIPLVLLNSQVLQLLVYTQVPLKMLSNKLPKSR